VKIGDLIRHKPSHVLGIVTYVDSTKNYLRIATSGTVTLTQGILRSAVMEGIHTIDISLIIAPVVHEFIKGAALRAGIDFNEGFENEGAKKALSYSRDVARAKSLLKDMGVKDMPDPMSLEDTEMPEPQETMEQPMEEPEQQGLMARRI